MAEEILDAVLAAVRLMLEVSEATWLTFEDCFSAECF